MVSSMRRVAAISAGPRSASPRGRRALSLLVLSGLLGLSAISVYIATVRLVAAALWCGKRAAKKSEPSKGVIDHVIGADRAIKRHSQRSRSLLAPVHPQPGLQ